MKRLMKAPLLVAVLFLLLASGCRGVSSYLQPKPDPNECWISTDPPIYFGWDEEYYGRTGEVVLSDGSRIPIVVGFDYGVGVDISRPAASGELIIPIIHGRCEFSRDKVVVTVTMDNENWLDGAETITFVRHDRETAVLP